MRRVNSSINFKSFESSLNNTWHIDRAYDIKTGIGLNQVKPHDVNFTRQSFNIVNHGNLSASQGKLSASQPNLPQYGRSFVISKMSDILNKTNFNADYQLTTKTNLPGTDGTLNSPVEQKVTIFNRKRVLL